MNFEGKKYLLYYENQIRSIQTIRAPNQPIKIDVQEMCKARMFLRKKVETKVISVSKSFGRIVVSWWQANRAWRLIRPFASNLSSRYGSALILSLYMRTYLLTHLLVTIFSSRLSSTFFFFSPLFNF